jgi:rod shape-determining protein MreC|tara:strand:- start:2983 stop:3831 length:849 start_codon:yes stop_codon:yes gene_type:complete
METSRDDVGIAIRSAFLARGTKQKFSLFALIILSLLLIFAENIKTKPLNYVRSIIKDSIYRGSQLISLPSKSFDTFGGNIKRHFYLYTQYNELKEENDKLKNNISKSKFLELENNQLRRLIEEQVESSFSFVSSRVIIDKQSPYLNSFIINVGSNKSIKNGMAVLHGENFIGRTVDVNFFSSRVLLVSDLNSRIPIISEPSATHAILIGQGTNQPYLEYIPENHRLKNGDKVYTSGKEGIFATGLPIGEIKIEKKKIKVLLFSDLNQITFINVKIDKLNNNK